MSNLPGSIQFIAHGSGGAADVLQLATRPRPEPRDSEVLIAVRYAGVNRPDIAQRAGKYPPPAGASPYLGLEVSGHIVARGSKVTEWQVGDAVCALTAGGGYAEYCVAEASHCLPSPRGLTLEQAAALPENYFTVWTNLLDRGRLQRGETVLIHGGSSGIGYTAIQFAKRTGARVITTVGSASKVTFCRKLGADLVVNYREEDFADAIETAFGKEKVDVVLDMVGGPYLPRNLRVLGFEGRLVQIALLQGGKAPEFDLLPIMARRLTLTGSTLRPRSVDEKAAIASALRECIWPWLEDGSVKTVIHAVFPLAAAADAHRLMESSQHIGKILLRVDERASGR